MANAKTTKRALSTSIVALLLCFTMLLGTTFAWFTDSVTSENNIIKSGNLDITLEYYNGTEWKNVQDASDILAGDLWEPGYVDVAYLRIKNAGSLALKYNLGVNIVSETVGKNVNGEDLKLSDYIYFDVFENVNGETGFATREAALENTTETNLISDEYTKSGELIAGSDYVYLAMVVYMPTSVDNKANHDGTNIPEINLGISIAATQLASEKDSFDEKYDDGLNPTFTYVKTVEDFTNALNEGGNIALMDDITLTSATTIANDVNIDLNGNTLSSSGLTFGGKVAIKNGVIKSETNTNMEPHIKVEGDDDIVLENVTIYIDDYLNYQSNGSRAYGEYTGLEIYNAKAILNNCTITVINETYRTWNYAYGITMTNGELVMNGGSIKVQSAGASIQELETAISAIGNCTVTLNNVYVESETLGTTMGHLIINTTDTTVTDSDFVSFGGTYEYSFIN